MKGVLSTILLLIPIAIGFTSDFVFEFGVDQGENVVYTKDGTILILNYNTEIDLPIPRNIMITYVKVTVNALSSPKVDYDNYFRRVSIKYTWSQITLSTYSIIVKGIPIE